MTRFLQRYSANRCTFTFQKEKNCFHFTQSLPPLSIPLLLLKVTFISKKKEKNIFVKKICFREFLWVGLRQSDVTSAYVSSSRLQKCPRETYNTQIGGFDVNERRFKHQDPHRGLMWHFIPARSFTLFHILELLFNEIYSNISYYGKYFGNVF